MQIATTDFAEKAAAHKATSISLRTDYSESQRVNWLTINALHYAYGSLAGAANKLENAPQGSETFGNLIASIADQIAAVEALLAPIDIEKVRTDAVYAGSQLQRAQTARHSAGAIDGLAAAVAQAVTASKDVEQAVTARTKFESRPTTKVAVVKGDFTHTRGGGPVKFYTGEHCDIDNTLDNGDMRIASGGGSVSVYFTAEEVARLFNFVEV